MQNYSSIVILTGAGISAESGIETFRASDGLWHEHAIEDVATPEGFKRDPALVHTFYNQRRSRILEPDVIPNAAHHALAKLESAFAGKVLVITQNIDNLHERAGSENLLHIHGELLKMRCSTTQKVYEIQSDLSGDTLCECCRSKNTLRPHIVWFNEMPFYMDEIQDALEQCDLFLAIGTSGHVYPAAGFVDLAASQGAETLEINLEPSNVHNQFNLSRQGLASQAVPDIVDTLLSGERLI